MLNSELLQEGNRLQHRLTDLPELLATERVVSYVLVICGKPVEVLSKKLEYHKDAPKLDKVVLE